MLLLENLDSRCCLDSGFCCMYMILITVGGCLFFFFVGLLASVISLEYFVVAKARCNWYLHDINNFLYQKNTQSNINMYFAFDISYQ
jgi:hypothetical protein